jgi:hypothetical protein
VFRRRFASPGMRLGITLSASASDSRNQHASVLGHGQCARAQHPNAVAPDLLWLDYRMFKRLVAGVLLALLLTVHGLAQSPSAFPVDITAARAPQPVTADGRSRLLYELHLTNFSPKPIELTGLDVLGGDDARPLDSYRGEALEKLLVAVGPTDSAGKVRAIGGGRSAVIFLDLTLDDGVRVPAELRHWLLLSITGKDGATIEKTVRGPRWLLSRSRRRCWVRRCTGRAGSPSTDFPTTIIVAR